MESITGGWQDWTWDESLFAGAARYYEQGRLPYAPGLADALARNLPLDGRGRLLDVGCGPGTVTLRLAPLFQAVTGLDPDQEMLACAARAAAALGIGNATWVRERAEALPAGLGAFQVVTFAASFHWMDRPLVASAVATMLDHGGAAVQVDAPGYRPDALSAERGRGSLPYPLPPDGALEDLRCRYLGSDRRAGQGIRNTSPGDEDSVFQQAGFLPARTVTVPDQRTVERTVDDVVATVFSASATAPHLFGDRLEAYERDLRQLLLEASPAGKFSVRLPDNILRIWQLPATSRHLVQGMPTPRCTVRKVSVEIRTVEDHLAGKPAEVIDLYERFIAAVSECGPFTYRVTKTAITLKGSRRGFAGAKPTQRSLDGYLDLQRQLQDPRIKRASPYTTRLFVHQFRITSLDQLDPEFRQWIREAYAVGAGAHLER